MNNKGFVIFLGTGLIAIGLLIDVLNISFFHIEGYENYVLIVIQIQATISTLGLSITTIISNVMKQEEYGVSVSDFIMNRNNRPLTQKTVIILSLSLILCSLLFFAMKVMNLVCSILVVEVLLLVYLLTNVSMIFNRGSVIRDKIFELEILKPKKAGCIENFFKSFVDSDDILESKANDYLKKAEIIIDHYLSDKELLTSISEGVSQMVSKCLVNGNSHVADVGVDLLLKYYRKFDEKKLIISEDYSYGVFSSAFSAIADAYDHISKENYRTLYKAVPFLVFKTQLVGDRTGIDVRDAILCASFCARNCLKNSDERLKSIFNVFVPEVFDGQFLGTENCEDRITQLNVENATIVYYLSFANELIKAGKTGFISDSLFTNFYMRFRFRDRIPRLYCLGIIVLCLYYSVLEKDRIIPDYVKKNCSLLLVENWNKFKSYLIGSVTRKELSSDDIVAISDLLNNSEFIDLGTGKYGAMNDAIVKSIMIIYALCDLSFIEDGRAIIEDLISKEGYFRFMFFMEYPDRARELIEEVIKKVEKNYGMLDSNVKTARVSDVYSTIEEILKKVTYDTIVKDSKKEIEEIGNLSEIESSIAKDFKEHVCEGMSQFKSFDIGTDKTINSIHEIETSVPVDFLSQNHLFGYFSSFISESLCSCIIKYLCVYLDTTSINSDDNEMLSRIIDNLSEYDSVIGSCVFLYRDYSFQKRFEDLIESKKNYIVNDTAARLAFFDSKKVSIALSAFSVHISEFDRDEIFQREKKVGDKYNVNITNNVFISLSEDELVNYYHARIRKVVFKCSLSIILRDEKVGKLIKITHSSER